MAGVIRAQRHDAGPATRDSAKLIEGHRAEADARRDDEVLRQALHGALPVTLAQAIDLLQVCEDFVQRLAIRHAAQVGRDAQHGVGRQVDDLAAVRPPGKRSVV
jgi:hypothetical protein